MTTGANGVSVAEAAASGVTRLTIDTDLYTVEALFRACYKFTDRCYLFLEPANAHTIVVEIRPRRPGDAHTDVAGTFANELIDQRVRADVARETRAIKELIVAQAFVEADLQGEVPVNLPNDLQTHGR